MSSQEEFQYHRAVVDLLEKIERHLAPAPSEAAKVECPNSFPVGNCPTCGELVAPWNKHAKYEGGYTCQPAPPEPAAPVVVEPTDRPMDFNRIPFAPAAREMPEAVRVGTFQLEELLKWAHLAEVSLRTGFAPPTFLGMDLPHLLRISIAAVRQQAAHGRKVELGKVRELIEWEVKNNGSGLWAAALAELDAADGKGEGRG